MPKATLCSETEVQSRGVVAVSVQGATGPREGDFSNCGMHCLNQDTPERQRMSCSLRDDSTNKNCSGKPRGPPCQELVTVSQLRKSDVTILSPLGGLTN